MGRGPEVAWPRPQERRVGPAPSPRGRMLAHFPAVVCPSTKARSAPAARKAFARRIASSSEPRRRRRVGARHQHESGSSALRASTARADLADRSPSGSQPPGDVAAAWGAPGLHGSRRQPATMYSRHGAHNGDGVLPSSRYRHRRSSGTRTAEAISGRSHHLGHGGETTPAARLDGATCRSPHVDRVRTPPPRARARAHRVVANRK